MRVVPDLATVSLGVEVHAKTLAEARRDNDARVAKVLAAASRLGINRLDVQTAYMDMGIVYEIDGVTPKYFHTRKSIVVALHDLSKLERLIGDAVDAGATHIHGVQF